MSISVRLSNALNLVRNLSTRKLLLSDFPASKGFHPKGTLIQCRRCKGTGTEEETADNCRQCGGRGVEKVSTKTLRRTLVLQKVTQASEGQEGK